MSAGNTLFYVHGMGGTPADWLWVQDQLPGKALALDGRAANPNFCANSLCDSILENIPEGQQIYSLAGYSMGGRISLLAARELFRRGRAPSTLILVSTGFGLATEAERETRAKLDSNWADLASNDPEEFWLRWYAQDLFASFRSLPTGHKEAWERARKALDIAALSSQLRSLSPGRHEYLRPVLGELLEKGLRVLYIVGELDKKYVELSRSMGEFGQQITVAVIPGAGHILPLEAPLPLAAEIRKFTG